MKTTKTFRQQILSMTAGEIIMSMVKGLEKPVTKINMSTFGSSNNDVCYGCAATNTICKITDVKFNKLNIKRREYRATAVKSTEQFLELFECAIDELRRGYIDGYNSYAAMGKFRRIQNPTGLELPYIESNYNKNDLNVYKQLAKVQRK